MGEKEIHRRGAESAEMEWGNDRLTGEVIAAAIEVHRFLGPGLLESAYQGCLATELDLRRLGYRREVELPLIYKGNAVDCSYRLDFVVEEKLVLELKSVTSLEPIHHAQVLTYLRLSSYHRALLINFNVPLLKDGIKRIVLSNKSSAPSAPLR
ncbi:MAG: GxxExxY protein [Sumerlaeia bacterium]